MQQLFRSLYPVQTALFGPRRTSFEGLAEELQSEVLFIACSDSRINPNVLTRNEPGEPLILRFAGNIVPTQGADWSGEAASHEFAVSEHRLAA